MRWPQIDWGYGVGPASRDADDVADVRGKRSKRGDRRRDPTLHDGYRAWKGFDWDVLNRLHERGFIEDPVNTTKSVIFTEEGLRESERLFNQHFVILERPKN